MVDSIRNYFWWFVFFRVYGLRYFVDFLLYLLRINFGRENVIVVIQILLMIKYICCFEGIKVGLNGLIIVQYCFSVNIIRLRQVIFIVIYVIEQLVKNLQMKLVIFLEVCFFDRLIVKGMGYYVNEMRFVVVIFVSKMFVVENIDLFLYMIMIIRLFFIKLINMINE